MYINMHINMCACMHTQNDKMENIQNHLPQFQVSRSPGFHENLAGLASRVFSVVICVLPYALVGVSMSVCREARWGGMGGATCRLPGPCSQARVLWLPLPILEIWEPEKLQVVLERGMGFCLGLCFGQPLSDRRSWILAGFLTFIIS